MIRRKATKADKPEPTPLDRALRLVARKSRTESELNRALQLAGVLPDDRAAAVARLRELGYMDDAAVATARARTLLGRGNSQRFVQQKLRQQGVTGTTAKAAADDAGEGVTELQLVQRALEKKLRGRAPRDDKERQRIFRSLASKGHRPALVAEALKLRHDGIVEEEDEAGG